MPRFSANIGFMFNEVPFVDRYAAAAQAGFRGIECPFPYEVPPAELAQFLPRHGVQQVLCNLPPNGMAAIPGQEEAFAAGLGRALTYARALDCPRLHAMAGAPPAEMNRADCEAVYVRNLKWAAETLQPHGVRLLIEPINTTGMPGYFLHTAAQARRIMDQVGHDNLFLQLDLYHCQIMTGNLSETIKTHLEVIDHFQIAGHPGRHEPDIGEINYPYLFDLIDDLGYTGWVGCEYRPRADTVAGLIWLRPFLDGTAAKRCGS
jgi:hydroxypyruvate isomerase